MNKYLELAIVLVIYIAVGHGILRKAFRNIRNGQIFDENFLMVVATFGALAMGEYEEAISVMVLYRIGEYFQDKAVAKSRRSIADLMDIRPDYANVEAKTANCSRSIPKTSKSVRSLRSNPANACLWTGSSKRANRAWIQRPSRANPCPGPFRKATKSTPAPST